MYARLLVPLDGSPMAEQVLPYVRMLAPRLGARVHLLLVVPEVLGEFGEAVEAVRVLSRQARDQARRSARDYLERIGEGLKAEGLSTSWGMEEGMPARLIVEEAQREPHTLVMMTTHGHTGLARALLGNVADRVLRTSEAPVFLVRARPVHEYEAPHPPQTVLVPLDGSEVAEQALPHASAMARTFEARLLLLRVVSTLRQPLYGLEFLPPVDIPVEVTQRLLDSARRYLEGVAEGLRREGLPVEVEAVEGLPAEAILRTLARLPAGMVAMTTHGRTGLARWLLGSITEEVVRRAEQPVLAVRAHS